jgi:aspartate racemase
MKIIGLLGGMSWESTAQYYKIINEEVRHKLGGLHSAKILIYSVNFAEISKRQHDGDWDGAAQELISAAQALVRGGAECLLICTNTMHKVADRVQAALPIPLIHIADATAMRLKFGGIQRAGLLGTRFTMEQDFYIGRLAAHGIEVLVPNRENREIVHRVIYDELCKGQIVDSSRAEYRRIIKVMEHEGVGAVVLGCTEIGLLVGHDDSAVPLFDTTRIHAEAAVKFALGFAS